MQGAAFCPYWIRCSAYGSAFPVHSASTKTTIQERAQALSTITVFHTALLLIKELTPQQKLCSDGPVLMDFTGITMFCTILRQLIEWPFED